MPGAVLRLLQNGDGSERLDHSGHLFGLVAYHNHSLTCFERLARANDVFHERASARLMQDFRKARFEASTLSRGEDNYG